MDVTEILRIVWRRKYLFVVVLLAVNVAAVVFLKLATRVFEAQALILVDQGRSPEQRAGGDAYSGALRQDRFMKSQAKIAESETVVADAIRQIRSKETGNPNYVVLREPPKQEVPQASFMDWFDVSKLAGLLERKEPEEAISTVQNALRVDVEANTDLMKVSYRSVNPVRATLYANQISRSLVDRQIKLYGNPLAAQFFREREQAYRNQLAEATKKLEKFSVANQTYSIADQQKLQLARREKVLASLSATRSSIERTAGELDSLRMQLSSLKSKINLPPEIFGETNFNGRAGRSAQSGSGFSDDPPLLHVRLYQESAQKIINLNADIAGLKASEANQQEDLKSVDKQLQVLASRQAEFDRLQRQVEQFEAGIDLYTKKSAEAEIESAWKSNERLSNMQLVQEATVPLRPVFPKAALVLPLGILAGIVAGIGATLLRHFLSQEDTHCRRERGGDVADLPMTEMPRARAFDPIRVQQFADGARVR